MRIKLILFKNTFYRIPTNKKDKYVEDFLAKALASNPKRRV